MSTRPYVTAPDRARSTTLAERFEMSTIRPPQALVTGASGFIGRHLILALARSGLRMRALVRSDDGAARVRAVASDCEIDVAFGDVTNADSLGGAAAGCDLVFHLAGSNGGSIAEMRSVHIGGTLNVLRALEPHARVVYVSSTSVYGWGRLWPVDDTMPPQSTSAYGDAKHRAEGLVRRWQGGSAVIARPTIVYGIGDEDGMLAQVLQLLQRPGFRFAGDGRNRVHLTHVDDVVDGLVRLGTQGDGVFVLAGPKAVPVSHVLGLLADGASLPHPIFGARTGFRRAALTRSYLGTDDGTPR